MNNSQPNDMKERGGHHASPQASASTTDVAKEQAAKASEKAGAAAQQVAGVAKEQVGQVAGEVGDQLKSLITESKSEFADQAQTQQTRAASGLHSLADQLGSMAGGAKEQGVVTDVAHQAAQKAHQAASWLEDREPGAVLGEVRAYARRRPGMFLLVALGAGVVAGRFARGLSADPSADQNNTAAPTTTSQLPPLASPGPAPELAVTGEPFPSLPPAGDYR